MIKNNLLACLAALSLITINASAMLKPLRLFVRMNSTWPNQECGKKLSCCKFKGLRGDCAIELAEERARKAEDALKARQNVAQPPLTVHAPPTTSSTVSTGDFFAGAVTGYLAYQVLNPEKHRYSPSTTVETPSYTATEVYSTRQDPAPDRYHDHDSGPTHDDSGDVSD